MSFVRCRACGSEVNLKPEIGEVCPACGYAELSGFDITQHESPEPEEPETQEPEPPEPVINYRPWFLRDHSMEVS